MGEAPTLASSLSWSRRREGIGGDRHALEIFGGQRRVPIGGRQQLNDSAHSCASKADRAAGGVSAPTGSVFQSRRCRKGGRRRSLYSSPSWPRNCIWSQ